MSTVWEMVRLEWRAWNATCNCGKDPTIEISDRCPNPAPVPNDVVDAALSDPLVLVEYVCKLERIISKHVDISIKFACETRSQNSVAKAAGISEAAIRKRKSRGWVRSGPLGRPR